MLLRTAPIVTVVLAAVILCLLSGPSRAQENGPKSFNELESELSEIERELSGLEREVDSLLEDLVDPRVTSLSIFFTSQELRGQVPVSLEIVLDGERLVSRQFDETARLVLMRGGSVEVYSGVAEPGERSLQAECFLSAQSPQTGLVSAARTTFRLEIMRAMANYLEISLDNDPARKTVPFRLGARHWSREP